MIEDLNVLDSENYFRMVDLSINNNVSELMVLLNDVIGKGFDGGLLIQGLARHVRNVLMAKDPQTLPLLEVSERQRQRYMEQAKKAPAQFLYQALRLMNQCDINYRQSSNKRLLVELTLIEVAQITQPDEGPGGGRRPRRLKSLFKNLIQQSQPIVKPAPQVAAAATQNRPDSTTAQNPTVSKPQEPVRPTPRPSLSNITSSWRNLRQQAKPGKMQILSGTEGSGNEKMEERENFNQEDLEFQWMSMCNRMPQNLSGIAARMKNMNPVIKEMPAVELVVPNEIMKAEVEAIQGSIVSTLKLYLHNSAITLSLRVAEQDPHQKVLTRREQFEAMRKQNPAVEKLREAFDLDF